MVKLIIIGIITVAVIVGGVFYFSKDASQRSLLNELDNVSNVSLLTVINSKVQTKALSQDKFIDVASSVEVEDGATIKTFPTGRAIIESSNSTTTVIDKNSEFTVISQEENKTKIQLESGSLWAQVKKVFNKGEYYQIETLNAVATVRGTAFGIAYKDNKTIVLVTESKVSIIPLDSKTKKPNGDEVVVEANQKATIITGAKPVIEPISDSDKKSEWYRFNQTLPTSSGSSIPKPSQNLGGIGTTPVPTKVTSSPTPKPTMDSTNPPLPSVATPTPTPTPIPKSEIQSVVPKTIELASSAKDFTINGKNLTGSKQVLLGGVSIQFFVLDSLTIIATVSGQIQPGVYDVVVVTPSGVSLTLTQALTVR